MNRIQEIFAMYNNECCEYVCEPATERQVQIFLENCGIYNIPQEIANELAEYYTLNNNFFEYFTCDDPTIFEWYEDGCLWLGQRDLWTFRCLIDSHKYAIGSGGDMSFGEEYEFDTIEEMLQAFLSGDKV